MKFKLDENLHWRLAAHIATGGHEVDTVRDEGLSGREDQVIYEACVAEGRVLITLDLDFSNPLRFPPEPAAGIVILRPPRAILPAIEAVLVAALPTIKTTDLSGQLWIVEAGRIRVYTPKAE